MRKKYQKTLGVISVFLVVAVLTCCFLSFYFKKYQVSAEKSKREITIFSNAAVFSETESSSLNSLVMALEDGKEELDKFNIKVVGRDSSAYPSGGEKFWKEKNINDVANDPTVLFYVESNLADAGKTTIPITNQMHLAQISTQSTLPNLTKTGFGVGEPAVYYPEKIRNFFRVIPTDDIEGKIAARWAKNMGADRIFILNDNNLYGRTVAKNFETEAKNLGIKILGNNFIGNNTSTFEQNIQKIKNINPDLIFISGLVCDQEDFFTRLGEQKLRAKVMGSDSFAADKILDSIGNKISNGIFFLTPGDFSPRNERMNQFVRAYRTRFLSDPDQNAFLSYEAGRVIVDVLKQAPKNVTREQVIDILRSSKFQGINGSFNFDQNGDINNTVFSGMFYKNGQLKFVKELK